jgi:hypothetical protein
MTELASAIVGATRPEQVHANARVSGIQLTPDTLAAIEVAGTKCVAKPEGLPCARGHIRAVPPGTACPAPKVDRCGKALGGSLA